MTTWGEYYSRPYKPKRKLIEEQLDQISVRGLRRFLVGEWMYLGPHESRPHVARIGVSKNLVAIHWRGRPQIQHIPIAWVKLKFGYRPWLECSFCGRRARRLFLTDTPYIAYKCRRCHKNLAYATEHMTVQQRMCFKSSKTRLKLNGEAMLTKPFPRRPRGMKQSTYAVIKLKAELREAKIRSRLKAKLPNYRLLGAYVAI